MSSSGRVTITLGRSGQVVKRANPLSGGSYSEIGTSPSGSKGDLRERLGSNTRQFKRRRTENGSSILGDDTMEAHTNSNRRVGHNDLRLKLINKQKRRRGHEDQRNADLREKLSQKRHASLRSSAQQGARDLGAQRSSRLGAPEQAQRLPPTRSADDLLQLDSLRRSYSYRSLDGRRNLSPDRIISISRAISPPRSYEPRHAEIARSVDASRFPRMTTNGVVDPLRSVPYARTLSTSYVANPVVRAPAPAGDAPMSLRQPETPATIRSLLNSLDLEKYLVLFQAEEVDMSVLKQMGDGDLKALGIPMGPRKKILLALLSQSRQQQQRR